MAATVNILLCTLPTPSGHFFNACSLLPLASPCRLPASIGNIPSITISRRRSLSPVVAQSINAFQTAETIQSASSFEKEHEEEEQRSVDLSQFVEVGRFCAVHGLKGELRVIPSTDFPEERFRKPGTRWLKFKRRNVVTLKEFELVRGREHAGKHQWLVKFKEVDSVEQAKDLVGASMLVKSDDRPALLDDEYYCSDMYGTSVFLKDTGELVGSVVGIYNTGAHDLLRVRLSKNQIKEGIINESDSGNVDEDSLPQIWIPFVDDIVPDVDLENKRLLIAPPEGLLELNLPQEKSSNKVKQKEEWKQRRKTGQKIAAVKRKLHSIGQEHVLFGLSNGDDSQKQALLDQIFSFDYKLLKRALEDLSETYERFDLSRHINLRLTKNWWLSLKEIKKGHFNFDEEDYVNQRRARLEKKGLELVAQCQTAVILSVDVKNIGNEPDAIEGRNDGKKLLWHDWFQFHCDRIRSVQKLISLGGSKAVKIPLIIFTTKELQLIARSCFQKNNYYGLKEEQVWFMTQEYLPCISKLHETGENQIYMESPWDISRAPLGSGSIVFSLLNQNILEKLRMMGIIYVQVCSVNYACPILDSTFIAFVDENAADVAVKLVTARVNDQSIKAASDKQEDLPYVSIWEERKNQALHPQGRGTQEKLVIQNVSEGSPCFDMIFSMRYLWKLTKKLYKTEYYTEERHISNNEENAEPATVHQLQSSIYSLLKFTTSDKVALFLYH